MKIELDKKQLEKAISDYIQSELRTSVEITGICLKESGCYSRKIDYKNIENITVEAEI